MQSFRISLRFPFSCWIVLVLNSFHDGCFCLFVLFCSQLRTRWCICFDSAWCRAEWGFPSLRCLFPGMPVEFSFDIYLEGRQVCLMPHFQGLLTECTSAVCSGLYLSLPLPASPFVAADLVHEELWFLKNALPVRISLLPPLARSRHTRATLKDWLVSPNFLPSSFLRFMWLRDSKAKRTSWSVIFLFWSWGAWNGWLPGMRGLGGLDKKQEDCAFWWKERDSVVL